MKTPFAELIGVRHQVPVINLPIYKDVERSYQISDEEVARKVAQRELARMIKEAEKLETYYD